MTTSRRTNRRRRGEGTVQRMPDGRYSLQISLGVVDGKRLRPVFYGESVEACQEQALIARNRHAAGQPLSDQETLGVYLQRWLARMESRVERRTWKDYEQVVRLHVTPLLGDRLVRRVTAGDVEDMMNALREKNLSGKRINDARRVVYATYKHAVRDGLASYNPAAGTETMPHRTRRFATLDAPHLSPLLEAAGDRAPLLVCAIGLGLRQSELLALTWADIDGERVHVRRKLERVDGEWRMGPPKTPASQRIIPLTEPVREALRMQRARQLRESQSESWVEVEWPDGEVYQLVFRTPSGAPMDGRPLARWLRGLIRQVNAEAREHDPLAPQIPEVRFHDLRHTFATMLLERGEELVAIKELLGHTSIATTGNIYAKVTEAKKRSAVAHMDGILPRLGKDDRQGGLEISR